MSEFTINGLAGALGLSFEGNGDLTVTGLAEPSTAGPWQLAVAMEQHFVDELAAGRARAAVLAPGADWRKLGLEAAIFAPRARLAMAGLTRTVAGAAHPPHGVHQSAVIDRTAQFGPGASVAANAVIDAEVTIGAEAVIGPNVWVGAGVTIGDNARLGAGSAIAPASRIGANFVSHANVSIGGDGFSFVSAEKSALEEVRETLADASVHETQGWIKIHSLGGVVIGDDVEIGSNSSVDAGTIRATEIRHGTKIDALVQVGHNAHIGRNCLLCAHVAVGGSAVVGDGSVLGGQVGVADNITLGAGVIAGGATKILSNVPAGRAILGYPAMRMADHVESYKALRRLPRLLERLRGLEKEVSKRAKKH